MNYHQSRAQTFDPTAKMSQRLDNTKLWVWCLLALHAGSVWGVAQPITVRPPPSNPSTIEAQAKFFQYRHLPKADEYDQGHRLGSDRHFTERHERAKPSDGVFSAKVRWGDKKGGYGEHYWDLNHAGNAGNIGDDGDDGSYRENDNSHDHYDEPNNNSPSYGHDDTPSYENDDYDPEKSSYEERERAKRAYPKSERVRKYASSEKKHPKSSEQESEEEPKPKKQNHKNREEQETAETAETSQEEEYENEEEDEFYEKPKPRRQQYKKKEDDSYKTKEEDPKPKEKNQVVLVVSHNDDADKQQSQYVPKNQPAQSKYLPKIQPAQSQYLPQNQQEQTQYVPQNQQEQTQYLPQNQQEQTQYLPQIQPALNQYLPQNQAQSSQYLPQQQAQLPYVPKQHLEPPHFVPYEGGAGVRQHQQPEVSAATTVPRLFLEPSTGHVVDRTTGQAYVLQPIAPRSNYN